MFKASIAALLLAAPLVAIANANDPCIAEANQMDAVSLARDAGTPMQDVIKARTFETPDEYERYLRKVALAYGNPELSGEELGDAIYEACQHD